MPAPKDEQGNTKGSATSQEQAQRCQPGPRPAISTLGRGRKGLWKGPGSLLCLSGEANSLPTDSDCPATAWLEGVMGGREGKVNGQDGVSAASLPAGRGCCHRRRPNHGTGMVGRRAMDGGWMDGQMDEQMDR